MKKTMASFAKPTSCHNRPMTHLAAGIMPEQLTVDSDPTICDGHWCCCRVFSEAVVYAMRHDWKQSVVSDRQTRAAYKGTEIKIVNVKVGEELSTKDMSSLMIAIS
ncbi:unnamed protein product [Sphagnum balticum]